MPHILGLGRPLHGTTACCAIRQSSHLPTHCGAVPRRWATLALVLSPLVLADSSQHASAAIIDEAAAMEVFSVVAPSVVTIQDIATVQGRDVEEGVGSGFVWDKYGHIVTNSHVINQVAKDQTGTQRVRVTFNAGLNDVKSFDARILVNEPSQDLAVLKVDALDADLLPVRVGSASGIKVGQYVFALGNPSGFSRTQTSGVVSGLNRAIPSPAGTRIPGAIQTDAAISAGNSGGPLVDTAGRVIGVCTATFTRQGTGRSSGVNLACAFLCFPTAAIPIDTVTATIPRLIVKASAG